MSGPRARAMQITLQGIREINLAFCPFDRYAGTWEVREYFNKVSNPVVKKSNPECTVNMKVLHDNSQPLIRVLYSDTEEMTYYPRTMSLSNIMRDIHNTTRRKLADQDIPVDFGVAWRY
ncbi:uncharacterized protein LOC134822793 [Bolinopsis microptera]|uniref:uncharacterized protein LOC134822793 n=1 Tax=Bolinopsis microptera TaxID=2820187 RepID=UPI003079EB46